ncbi:asparagine synthase (glutamine-hydrolyzing) [Pelagicoccus mobilis]|uniref:asparagine synthase (glutamine-hydrolyzing) n=1 Tax=Pelagicoccus mobilis TaxID=415221 RepID=A0A934VLX3_9BACT|nr:asparagine synthase (glutamine-hydrolyzing) [Pelagicoccus mobilis]MBK1878226.1 asparagine synthase (glutamine-hydrolyzing) [Pelagicoccus mobilis]
MCGIAGIWNNNQAVDPFELDLFTDSLIHRGPDARGTFIDKDLGLGHRRLSILDLAESANGPLQYRTPDGRVFHITYNGEIYNFVELRQELETFGYSFSTHCDTEVAVAAYAHWGEDCQRRFNGMWAFAVWDPVQRSLFLSRDRFGIKPLYYYASNERFAFASELKAFLHLKGFDLEFNEKILARSLANMFLAEPDEPTYLSRVNRCLPGHCIKLGDDRAPVITRWWNTAQEVKELEGKDEGSTFSDLFFDACRIRMRSDVPLATALSGGLDSSSVAAGLAHVSAQANTQNDYRAQDWRHAFVASFPNAPTDETKFAAAVAEHLGIQLTKRVMSGDELVENLSDFFYTFEEVYDLPIVGWLVYREISKAGFKISMDGHGGDELLGGYHHHPIIALIDAAFPKVNLNRIRSLRQTYYDAQINGERPGLPPLRHLVKKRHPDAVFISKHNWLEVEPSELFASKLYSDLDTLSESDFLTQRLYSDFHYTILPTILRNFDRLSMAHGIEIRTPLMDWRLVVKAFSTPGSEKIADGYTKLPLRKTANGLLPDSITWRTSKIGLNSPIEHWLKGDFSQFFDDTINASEFKSSNIWNSKTIKSTWKQYLSDRNPGSLPDLIRFVHTHHLIQVFTAKWREVQAKYR